MKALAREAHRLREAVGERFQKQSRSAVAHLRDLVKWLRNNVDLMAKLGEVAVLDRRHPGQLQVVYKGRRDCRGMKALHLAPLLRH